MGCILQKDSLSIISISSNLPWSDMWKRNQMMVNHLAQLDTIHKVIFVNPDLWLVHLLENFRTAVGKNNHKLYRYSLKYVFPRKVIKKIYVITPFYFLPFLGKFKVLRILQTGIQYGAIKSFIKNDEYILVLNDFCSEVNHKRLVAKFLKKAKLVVYDWSDDFVEFFRDADGKKKIQETCKEYIKRADVVFAVNGDLTERARAINPHSHLISNATDFDVMSRAVSKECRIPETMRNLQGPLLGYIGWITTIRMDTAIIKGVAERHPEWTLLFVGPVGTRFRENFYANKNVVFIPPVKYGELPCYLKSFDVCLLPHKINAHTKGNNPIKIYDYLAAGKPIVSTPIAGVEAVQDLIYLGKTTDEFCAAIDRALRENSVELQLRRMEIAMNNSWKFRISDAWNVITRHLMAEKFNERKGEPAN